MLFTEKDKELARQLVENTDMLDFVLKVLSAEDSISDDIYLNKNNEHLGEFMRSHWLAKKMLQERYAKIRQLAQEPKTTRTQTVPK